MGARATIIAATAVRNRLMTEQTLWRQKHAPVARSGLPLVSFEHELQLHVNGQLSSLEFNLPEGTGKAEL